MAITVKLKYLRIAPRKVRLVANSIRGKTAEQAGSTLMFLRKKACRPIMKLLNSGISAAKDVSNLSKSDLYISKIMVDEGPTLKRTRARAKGRLFPIMKRTSHVTITLDTQGKTETKQIEKNKSKIKKQTPGKNEISKKEKLGQKSKRKMTRDKSLKTKNKPFIQKTFRRKSF